MKLSGKTAIVTGGYRGLGLVIAQALLRQGARVAICGRSSENLKKLDSVLSEFEGSYLWTVCDITLPLQVSNFVKKVLHEFGSVDILINNAAIFGSQAQIIDYDPQDFKDVISVNIVGAFNLCQGVLPHMVAQNYGKIINVTGSHKIEEACDFGGAYYVSKLALDGLSSILAHEYGDTPISVNQLNPSGVKLDEILSQNDNEEIIPPVDLEKLFVYLASVDSNGINGKKFDAQEWMEDQKSDVSNV